MIKFIKLTYQLVYIVNYIDEKSLIFLCDFILPIIIIIIYFFRPLDNLKSSSTVNWNWSLNFCWLRNPRRASDLKKGNYKIAVDGDNCIGDDSAAKCRNLTSTSRFYLCPSDWPYWTRKKPPDWNRLYILTVETDQSNPRQ